MGTQISFIGAGSPTFTPHIVGDIARTPCLWRSKLIMYDVDTQKQQMMANVCRRFVRQIGAKLEIAEATDLNDAVSGSAFIINAALQGGWQMNEDIKKEIAEETGISHPIEAQARVGQLNFLLSVAKAISKKNPNAVLIQCANPIAEGGTLINRKTKVNFVGVCHGARKMDQTLGLIGIKPEEANATIAGINHNIWLLELLHKGDDAYPRLWAWINRCGARFANYVRGYIGSADYQISPGAIAMAKYFNLFPVGDTTRASQPHMHQWHKTEAIEKKNYGNSGGRESKQGFASKMAERENILNRVEDAHKNGGSINDIFLNGYSEWQVAQIIESMLSGKQSVHMVNVSNNGAIPGLPDDLIVEVPGRITKKRITVDKKFSFPEKVWNEAIVPHWQQVENHVKGFITNNKSLVIRQIMANPMVKNKKTANKIFKIWEKHDPYVKEVYS